MYQRLHKIRTDKGFSQTKLASLSGIGQSVISKIERGALTSPSSDTLTKLASTLECSVIDFIDEQPKTVEQITDVIQVTAQTADLPFVFDRPESTNEFTNNPLLIPRGLVSEIMISRPTFLNGLTKAYAIRQLGDEMFPRFKPQQILYVAPETKVEPGDDVIIVVQNGNGESHGLVREFVNKNTDGSITVRQYNPFEDQTIPKDKLKGYDCIVAARRRPEA
jgi:transcriptional regulator with XRE-family HTH domain